MVALGILPSAFSFFYLGVNFPPVVRPENTIPYYLFRWGTIPILISMFWVVMDRLFYRKKDFRVPFFLFLCFYILSLIFIFSTIVTPTVYVQSLQIGYLVLIALCIFLVLKTKDFTSLLFLFSICCFLLGSVSLTVYMNEPQHFSNSALTLCSHFLGFIFIALIFGYNSVIQRTEKDGIGIYFSLENKLKKIEEALEESQQRYQQVVENLNQGLFIVDKNTKTTYTNSFLAEMLGFTPADMRGKSIFEFMDTDSIDVVKNAFDIKTEIGDKEYEINLIKKDRTVMSALLFISPLFDKNNNKTGLLAAVQDISHRKGVEQQLHEKLSQLQKSELATLNIMEDFRVTILDLERAKNEIKQKNDSLQMMNKELHVARDQLTLLNQDLEGKVKERTTEVEMLLQQKDEFINQLSHDLKTPLTPLNTLLPIIKQREHDPKLLELLEVCISNVNFMRNLVTRTLELARLNSPSTPFNIDILFLVDEVNDVLNRKQTMFKENNITINNNISRKMIVEANSVEIKELFDNIIVNAVKYALPLEHLNILIDAKAEDNQVIVSIQDNGIGLSCEQLEHIFHEFYKADSSRHNLESTGLGLSICKRIVERHGGKIWAESPGLGKGSTFYFTLPITKKKLNMGNNIS